MISFMRAWAAVAVLAVVVAGCSSSSNPDIEPAIEAPAAPIAEPLATGPFTAAQIAKALGEKTFAYSGTGSGTVTFYADGTMSYEEAGKGSGTGIWQASDGSLCQARNPTSFLPKGTPSSCQPFSSDGMRYTAGSMQLQPSS